MKIACLSLALLIVLAGVSSAQTSVGLNIYAGGGIDFSMNDLGKYWKNGYHGTIGAGFSLTPGLEGVARYAHYTFPEDEKAVESNPGDSSFTNRNQDLKIDEYSFDIRANLGAPEFKMRPYALIGVGLAKLPDKSKFFYSIGGGFKVNAMPRVNFFLEGRYTLISYDNYDVGYFPVTIGLNISL